MGYVGIACFNEEKHTRDSNTQQILPKIIATKYKKMQNENIFLYRPSHLCVCSSSRIHSSRFFCFFSLKDFFFKKNMPLDNFGVPGGLDFTNNSWIYQHPGNTELIFWILKFDFTRSKTWEFLLQKKPHRKSLPNVTAFHQNFNTFDTYDMSDMSSMDSVPKTSSWNKYPHSFQLQPPLPVSWRVRPLPMQGKGASH